MATSTMRAPGLSWARCAATGALVLAVQFLLCWAAVAVLAGPRFSHMFVQLFTTQPTGSAAALVEGLCSAVVFGGLTGVFLAVFYNLFGALGRR